MIAKDWKNYTPQEADEKLLSIMDEYNGDIFRIFCVANPETRTGVKNGVISRDEALRVGALINEDFASYKDENAAKETVNTIFAEQHKKIAVWLSNGCRGPLAVSKNMNKVIGVRYNHTDGTETPITTGGIVLYRDLSFNPDGYGFTAVPCLAGGSM